MCIPNCIQNLQRLRGKKIMSAPRKHGMPLLLLKGTTKSAFWHWLKTFDPIKYSSGMKRLSGAAPTAVTSMQAQMHRINAPPASDHPVILSFYMKTGRINSQPSVTVPNCPPSSLTLFMISPTHDRNEGLFHTIERNGFDRRAG